MEKGKCNLGAGSTKNWKREQGAAKKLENGAKSKRNYQAARGKIKKEQGANRYEKGAVKIGKKGASAEIWKGAGRTRKNVIGSMEHRPPLAEPQRSKLISSLSIKLCEISRFYLENGQITLSILARDDLT